MKSVLAPEVEAGRVAGPANSGPYGSFALICPVLGRRLTVIASDGRDWGAPWPGPDKAEYERMAPEVRRHVDSIWEGRASIELPFPAWEHVSVSGPRIIPTWSEMEWVRDQFFAPEDWVIQFSAPRAEHLSLHHRCLHLWRVVGGAFPTPPRACV